MMMILLEFRGWRHRDHEEGDGREEGAREEAGEKGRKERGGEGRRGKGGEERREATGALPPGLPPPPLSSGAFQLLWPGGP